MMNNRQTYQVLLVMYNSLQSNYSLMSITALFLPASSNRITKDLTSTSNCNLMLGKPNDTCTNGCLTFRLTHFSCGEQLWTNPDAEKLTTLVHSDILLNW